MSDHEQAMSRLYDEVLDSSITERAVNFLARSHVLCEIADVEVAKDFVHRPEGREAARREWDDMDDDGRRAVTEMVAAHWSVNVNLAVRRLWHAARVLGFQPGTLDPQHVALVAASYLSRAPADVVDELEAIIGSS